MTEGNDLLPITNVPRGNNFETREYRKWENIEKQHIGGDNCDTSRKHSQYKRPRKLVFLEIRSTAMSKLAMRSDEFDQRIRKKGLVASLAGLALWGLAEGEDGDEYVAVVLAWCDACVDCIDCAIVGDEVVVVVADERAISECIVKV